MIEKIKNNTGSALLTTLFLLAGMVAIGFIGIEVMMSGFGSYMTQEASTQAYFAAEAGMERALSVHRTYMENNSGASLYHDNCSTDDYVTFSGSFCSSNEPTNVLPNSDGVTYKADPPAYVVTVVLNGRVVTLNSQGEYLNTAREIEVSFCVPTCVSVSNCSDCDGCGGSCN